MKVYDLSIIFLCISMLIMVWILSFVKDDWRFHHDSFVYWVLISGVINLLGIVAIKALPIHNTPTYMVVAFKCYTMFCL